MRFTYAFLVIVLPVIAFAQPKRPDFVLPVGHPDPIISAAFSPDGALAVTGSWDGSVIVWDARTGDPLRRFVKHFKGVCAVGFVAASDRVISASSGEGVFIWDSGTGVVDREFKYGGRRGLAEAAFSLDGKRICVAGGEKNEVALLDSTTGERVRVFEGPRPGIENVIACLTVSRSGSRLFAAADGGEWFVWDTDSGQRLAERKPPMALHDSKVTASFAADEKSILVSEAGAIYRWEFGRANALPVEVAKPGSPITALDPAHRYALYSLIRPNRTHLVDLKDVGIRNLEGVERVSAACFTDDGSRVFLESHGNDKLGTPINRVLGIWDTQTGQNVRKMQVAVRSSCRLQLIGARVNVADFDGAGAEWDLDSGKPPRTCQLEKDRTRGQQASTPDGRMMVRIDLETEKLIVTGESAPRRSFSVSDDQPFACAISADGKRVAAGMKSGKLILWDTVSGKQLLSIAAHAEPVQDVAMTPDAKRIFTTSLDGTTRVWDASTGKEIVRLVAMNDAQDWLVMTPDGRFDGSPTALKLAKVRTDGRLKLEPLANCAKDRQQPGLLASLWKGQPGR